jgi:hypothetical protein
MLKVLIIHLFTLKNEYEIHRPLIYVEFGSALAKLDILEGAVSREAKDGFIVMISTQI